MSDLAELKKEYVTNVKLANMELGNLDPRTKYSQEGVMNAAKQKLQTLRPKLMGLILGDSTTVYVASDLDLSVQLKEILEGQGAENVSQYDFNDLEKTIMETVYPKQIKGYAFNAGAVSRLNNALVDVRTIIGASFIPPIVANATDYRVFKNTEEASMHLQGILTKAYGNELKSLYLAKKMNLFTEKNMTNSDKMVFFVTGVNGNTKGLDQITGKTVFLNGDDKIPDGASGLQALVVSKLRKPKTRSTKNEE